MAEIKCRNFSGYKPCSKSDLCERSQCQFYHPVDKHILFVHLEALGAVLRSTSLLVAIKRMFPYSHLTWVTKAPAHRLLHNIPSIDRILTVSAEDLLALSNLRFELAFVLDKSLLAGGVLKQCQVDEVRGFLPNSTGAILPANPEAQELWELGLSNHKKFFVNQKSEQRLCHESLGLGEYRHDEYQVNLDAEESSLANARRKIWSPDGRPVIGINTGCSLNLPAKKLSVEGHKVLIAKILSDERLQDLPIVLLGGPEDMERNIAIARDFPVIVSPTQGGLRDGLVSVQACDLIFSGDSLGMHMAIALKKWVVAWFGPTCPQEIDLYGRGRKIIAKASCSPCWKKACDMKVMCYDQVDFEQVVQALAEGFEWRTSFSKLHFQGTSFSPSL